MAGNTKTPKQQAAQKPKQQAAQKPKKEAADYTHYEQQSPAIEKEKPYVQMMYENDRSVKDISPKRRKSIFPWLNK